MDKVLNRIIELRKSKKINQTAISDFLDISQAAYAKIESGDTKITIDRIFKIAEYLSVSVGYIMGFELDNDNYKKPEKIDVEKEKDQLKILAFHALERYVATKTYSKQLELDDKLSPEEEWKGFVKFQDQINEFKNGMFEAFVMIGFCTQEEISEYKEYKKSPSKT